jgi:hypothetical protein
MEVDFAPYGVRRGDKGWRRSTSYHPYELRQGTAEEKQEVSASGTGKRLLDRSNGLKTEGKQPVASDGLAGNGAAARAGHGGQARSPFDRFAR